jgi:hypothetical protein
MASATHVKSSDPAGKIAPGPAGVREVRRDDVAVHSVEGSTFGRLCLRRQSGHRGLGLGELYKRGAQVARFRHRGQVAVTTNQQDAHGHRNGGRHRTRRLLQEFDCLCDGLTCGTLISNLVVRPAEIVEQDRSLRLDIV